MKAVKLITMTNIKTLAENLLNLSVKEVQELSNLLKENYGIEAATVIIPTISTPEIPIEKNQFDIILRSGGPNKIAVIKLIKELTGLGLKESKELVDNTPKTIKEGVDKATAEELKNMLVEAGADIDIS